MRRSGYRPTHAFNISLQYPPLGCETKSNELCRTPRSAKHSNETKMCWPLGFAEGMDRIWRLHAGEEWLSAAQVSECGSFHSFINSGIPPVILVLYRPRGHIWSYVVPKMRPYQLHPPASCVGLSRARHSVDPWRRELLGIQRPNGHHNRVVRGLNVFFEVPCRHGEEGTSSNRWNWGN